VVQCVKLMLRILEFGVLLFDRLFVCLFVCLVSCDKTLCYVMTVLSVAEM